MNLGENKKNERGCNPPRMHGDEPNGGMTHDPGIGSAPRAGMNPHRSGPTGIDENPPRMHGDEPRQEVCLVRNLLFAPVYTGMHR